MPILDRGETILNLKLMNLHLLLKNSKTLIAPFVAVAISALLLNILYFISFASSPVIRSDTWRWVDKVVIKWSEIGFSISDLFYKRDFFKPALISNKLSLYLNFKYFGLDIRLDALIGFFGLCVIATILVTLYLRHAQVTRYSWLSAVVFLCAFASLTSMNVTEVYTWPLVTFGYFNLAIVVGIILCAWNFKSRFWVVSLFGAIGGFFLLGDILSLMLWSALLVSVYFVCLKDRSLSNAWAKWWAGLSGGFVLLLLLTTSLSFFYLKSGVVPPKSAVQLESVDWFELSTYVEIIRIISSSALVHQSRLSMFGDYATLATYVLSLIMFGLYLRFFVVLFVSKSPFSVQKFISLTLILYGSALVLSILVGRTAAWGLWTLHENRYVGIYQIITFALLFDVSFDLLKKGRRFFGMKTVLTSCGVTIFLVFQGMYILQAYASIPWLNLFREKQVRAIANYAVHGVATEEECLIYLPPLCGISRPRRVEVLSFLEDNNLNVFNPQIQLKYGIYPYDSVDNRVNVLDWGPQTVNVQQAAGPHVFWIRVSRLNQRGEYAISINGDKMSTVAVGGLVTFTVPDDIFENRDVVPFALTDKKYGQRQDIGAITLSR